MARMDRYKDDYQKSERPAEQRSENAAPVGYAAEQPAAPSEQARELNADMSQEYGRAEHNASAEQAVTFEQARETRGEHFTEKPKKKRKKWPIVLLVIILLAAIGYCAYQYFGPLKLNGKQDVVLYQGEKYEEKGVNSIFAKASGKVDTNTLGDYTIIYTVGKQSITRNVHVVDAKQLVVGLKGCENTLVREGDPYVESGAFAIDKLNGPVANANIKISGNVNTSKPGEYTVKYTAKAGYITKKIIRKVTVVPKDEFEADTDGIPVLMYHYVYGKEEVPDDLSVNYILNDDFEEQLKYLTENGYYYPSFTELRAYLDGKIALPKKSVILTFDDAQHGFFAYGMALLEKYKVPATSFVIGTQNGADKVKVNANPYIQFQSHSYDMHKAGGNIGHGGVISAMSKDEIVADLTKSFEQVGNSEAFAYPYGDYTDTALEAVEESGVLLAFTTEGGKVKVGEDFRKLSRVRVSGGNSLQSWIDSL